MLYYIIKIYPKSYLQCDVLRGLTALHVWHKRAKLCFHSIEE